MRNEAARRLRSALARGLAALALVLLLAAPAAARSWRIADWHSMIKLDGDGSIVVTERISFAFSGRFNGVFRSIPIDYPGPSGSNYRLFLKVDGVTDDAGNKLKFESGREGPYRKLKIYVPGAEDTTRPVVITYSVPNATRFFDDHDEFYWNVTGNDNPVPIDHASASVTFPAKAAGSLRAQAFTGVYGSHDQESSAEVNGAAVNFETTNPLPMRGGLTIDVYVPKGILHRPGVFTRAAWFLRGNPLLLLPLWTFAVMFAFWWVKGRDPDAGISVAPMYEPPAGMTPAETGALVDDSIDPRDITSTIVDLAVRGYVKIKEVEGSGFIFHRKDYEFELLKGNRDWEGLAPHERVMLQNIFQGGQVTRLSSLKNRFYTAIPVIRQDVMSALQRRGMYLVDPESANAYVIGAIVVTAAPFALVAWAWGLPVLDAPAVAIASGLLSAAIIWLFARQMTAKTLKGARTVVQIRGFQEFMNRVDADRLKRMPPDTFEKFLPYAMALGVEHHWAQAFAGIIKDPPSWYVGGDGYYPGWNPIFFTHTMSRMSSDMHQTFVAAPRASATGSGWRGGGFGGGGGFSGGGFGGGGTGAF